MDAGRLDRLPGFRRCFIVTSGEGWVRAEVEDDYHCMGVTIRHDEGVATRVEPAMDRAPWTTCPGALARLEETFTNIPLEDFPRQGQRSSNCTHLHDLAMLAAAHAGDSAPLVYDIVVSDPIDGESGAQLRRNGEVVLEWVQRDGLIVQPTELAGLALDKLRAWIDGLDPERQEQARILRWGAMMAHGRAMPLWDASSLAGNCYTFQPHIRGEARRIGEIKDFSIGTARPLEGRRTAQAVDRRWTEEAQPQGGQR